MIFKLKKKYNLFDRQNKLNSKLQEFDKIIYGRISNTFKEEQQSMSDLNSIQD